MAGHLAVLGGEPLRKAPFPKWPVFGREEEEALLKVLRSGHWALPEDGEIERFEKRFAEYHGAKFGIAAVNGTIALRIALLAAGLQAGDEVIVPPYTFLATATSVIEANGTPIFVDIEADTFNIDPKAIEPAVTPRTRAVIPVHLGGLPCDLDAIMALARRRGLTVIEDACHAHGSEHQGRRVGAIGHLGCFSFQSSKNLNCGEGGIILTNDQGLADACRSIHNCGRVPGGAWYEHHTISGNYRLTQFQAAILNGQLDRLDGQTVTRDRNGRYLAERLRQVPGIHPQVRGRGETRHAYHLFPFRYDASIYGVPRSIFLKALTAEGIPGSPGYTLPLYRQPVFANKEFGPYTGYRQVRPDLDYRRICCPVCELICAGEGCWIYQSVLLGTQSDMNDVVKAFEKIHDHRDELVKVPLREAKAAE